MSDEHVRLVAKIQHFYDVMLQRLNEMQDNSMSSCNEMERSAYKEKSAELTRLTDDFSKTFQNFLYREPHE